MDDIISIALPKGRLGEKIYSIFEGSNIGNSRKLIFENNDKKYRYFWIKPSDVPICVERGAADIGVCGSDILLEYTPDVYELLDLKTGICRMVVAAREDFHDDTEKTLRVATKFCNIAKNHFRKLGRDADIIKMNGSIEIAPMIGLSDVIVDIVETGSTLKENRLVITDTIVNISARLIANKASYKFKHDRINSVISSVSAVI